jgi:uncharacterized protein (DUF3084 family)
MRQTIFILPLLCAAALAPGCTATAKPTEGVQKPSARVATQGDKARTETHEAARAQQDYAYARRQELLDETNKELKRVQDDLDRLSAKVERSRAAAKAKAEAKAKLEAVREKMAQAKKELEGSTRASESTWERLRGRMDKANGELRDAFDKTREWVSDKIKP